MITKPVAATLEAVEAVARGEMSASIHEISLNCTKGSRISEEAKQKIRATTEVMEKLDQQAGTIGQVVELIYRIADKTDLLALNATIEAASAGEVGRSFAVVANEVARNIEGVREASRHCGKRHPVYAQCR